MRTLSKSKLIAWRQCPKRLWLEVHKPELAEVSAGTKARFATGHEVGAIAQRLYDPDGLGVAIDIGKVGVGGALKETPALMRRRVPLFEAAFSSEGALALADVMLPVSTGNGDAWRMIEVKSATGVKPYHRDDAAIQAHVARSAGVALGAIAVAHIDSDWTYEGGGDYRGLIVEADVTDEAGARTDEVRTWVNEARAIAARAEVPAIDTGPQCTSPFDCPFLAHCRSGEPQAEFPITWLPQLRSDAVKTYIAEHSVKDMRELPDEMLTGTQRRVKQATLSQTPHFDADAAARDLAPHRLPAIFLDFEAVQFAVPRWAGTRPYQQIPFQFSLHRLDAAGVLDHHSFLDISGDDPMTGFVQALTRAVGSSGPVFVYNASFENARLRELAERFPRYAHALERLIARVVDLLPITRRHYYHPTQRGSWSLKAVLPTIAPDDSYDTLDGVADGGGAVTAYLEAISSGATDDRRDEIRRQLLAYCRLDTLALVKVWEQLAGRR